MRILLNIIAFCLVLTCHGQVSQPASGKPKTLEETFVHLDYMFNDTAVYNFMLLPEDVAVSRLHFPFGMQIRNSWGLWKDSELKRYFQSHGLSHPDDMSSVIFRSYYRKLHNQPIDLPGQVERIHRIYSTMKVDTLANGTVQISYPELQKEKRTSPGEQLKFYPIGDTVLVTLTGKQGLFNKVVTFKGVGVIKGYSENKLNVTLTDLKKSEKVKTEYYIGQELNTWTASCTLIPPKNWKR